MLSDSDSEKSLMARFRGLFGHRTRALCLGACLLGGALSGMPIRPEEIEEHMRIMSAAKIVQVLEHEQRHPADPPGEGAIGAVLDRKVCS